METKPILFNTENVRAILDGKKTATRRIIKDPYYIDDEKVCCAMGWAMHRGTDLTHGMPYPDSPYETNSTLYVREAWNRDAGRYLYRANYSETESFYCNGKEIIMKWRPSIHMPKEAARIFLHVTDVRVERLQKMQYHDYLKEGLAYNQIEENLKTQFSSMWDRTMKTNDREKYGWAANPWVWVIEFEKLDILLNVSHADRLAAYEDTRLEPEEILNLQSGVIPAHWRDLFRAECEGRLLVLPCKVGDAVLRPNYDEYGIASIDKGTVYAVSINKQTNWFSVLYESGLRYDYTWEDLGKTVFLTREEAEKALEGMNNG